MLKSWIVLLLGSVHPFCFIFGLIVYIVNTVAGVYVGDIKSLGISLICTVGGAYIMWFCQ